MACEYICDGCGKRASAVFYAHGDREWHKPDRWFARADADGEQDACSRECIEKISANTKKTAVVMPW
jgi:hypothetical protein